MDIKTILKCGTDLKRILKKGNFSCCEVLKEMLNLLNHQGNTNQKTTCRFHLMPIKMCKINKTKELMMAGMWSKESIHPFLLCVQTSTTKCDISSGR